MSCEINCETNQICLFTLYVNQITLEMIDNQNIIWKDNINLNVTC